jgi:hypothetical protein
VADLPAERLVVVFHHNRRRTYHDVTYTLWRGGVTIYRDGELIAEHEDVLETYTDTAVAA